MVSCLWIWRERPQFEWYLLNDLYYWLLGLEKPNVENATKVLVGNTARKKLADISNLPQQTRALPKDEKSQSMSIASKEYIDLLQKENMALMKISAERDKLINVTGIELKKLRTNLLKMQQQNLQLARANSELLADLNSGKDRRKVVQHQLGCLNALLKVKNIEVQEKLKVKKREILDFETNSEAAKESEIGSDDDKLENAKGSPQNKSLGSSGHDQSKDINENKRPCTRSQSARVGEELKPGDELFGIEEDSKFSISQPSDGVLQENVSTSPCVPLSDENREGKDAPECEVKNKRPCARRLSARFKSEEAKPSEDFLEIQDGYSVCLLRDDKVQEDGLTSTCSIENDEKAPVYEEKADIPAPVYKTQESRRSSLNRPLRQAAKKVQTYKETPLNKKMRRPN